MEKELSGSYPIVIDDRESGRLSVAKEGLFWCFEATSEMRDGIIRLSVYGEDGAEGYLGVMEPKEGALHLRKKLSRSGLTGFPSRISHAGLKGRPPSPPKAVPDEDEPPPEPPVEERPPSGTETEEPYPEPEETCQETPAREHSPEPEPCLQEDSEDLSPPLIWRHCGCPCSYLSSIEAKQVFGAHSNVMEATDGEFTYLALPEDCGLSSEQTRLFPGVTVILGKRHLVCRVKNGRLV